MAKRKRKPAGQEYSPAELLFYRGMRLGLALQVMMVADRALLDWAMDTLDALRGDAERLGIKVGRYNKICQKAVKEHKETFGGPS